MSSPCRHPRCGNAEWHHGSTDGGFTEQCEPFKLGKKECECRTPAVYGTRPAPSCFTCKGTGYLTSA